MNKENILRIIQLRLLQAKKQTTMWMWFGRISPLLFFIGAVGFYEIVNSSIPFIFYASWVAFITVALIWWGWVLKIILDFIHIFEDVNQSVADIKTEVTDVCDELKKLTNKEQK